MIDTCHKKEEKNDEEVPTLYKNFRWVDWIRITGNKAWILIGV